MKSHKYNLQKGAIIGILFYFTLLFLSSMVMDNGLTLLNINKYSEGWVETLALAWLTWFSIKDLIDSNKK